MGKKKKIPPSWFSLTQHTSPLSGSIQNLKTLTLIAGEKPMMDFYKKEKKIGQINRMTSIRMLILSYTIQLLILNVCTKFLNPRWSSSWEICDENIWEKKNGQIKGMICMRMWNLSYTNTSRQPNLLVPNFKTLGAADPEKSLTQISLCITLEWEMVKRKKVKRRQKKF